MFGRAIAVLAASVCLGGCVVEHAGPIKHDSATFPRDNSEMARVTLRMGGGDLRLRGGSDSFARADFVYNVASWKPYVRYHSAAGHANLEIEQPGKNGSRFGHARYEWDLRLNREVPLELSVHFGAGHARLDLSNLRLRSVDIEMGVGKLDLDLRGTPARSYDVRIRGGVGEAIVRIPSSVGVYAEVEGGIGSIRADGLRREGNRYFNSAYDHSKTTIRLDIHGGIGSIQLVPET
jgi:hypothetical protein